MELTLEQLKKILPGNQYVDYWFHALSKLLPDYEINTPQRIAAFLAQCKHESGNFTAIRENLNYRAESLMRVWPRYFPTIDIARQYAGKAEMIANRVGAVSRDVNVVICRTRMNPGKQHMVRINYRTGERIEDGRSQVSGG